MYGVQHVERFSRSSGLELYLCFGDCRQELGSTILAPLAQGLRQIGGGLRLLESPLSQQRPAKNRIGEAAIVRRFLPVELLRRTSRQSLGFGSVALVQRNLCQQHLAFCGRTLVLKFFTERDGLQRGCSCFRQMVLVPQHLGDSVQREPTTAPVADLLLHYHRLFKALFGGSQFPPFGKNISDIVKGGGFAAPVANFPER